MATYLFSIHTPDIHRFIYYPLDIDPFFLIKKITEGKVYKMVAEAKLLPFNYKPILTKSF